MLTPEEQASAVFGPNYQAISQYIDILRSRGVAYGVIGPREGDRLWDRHVLNSYAVADLIPAGSHVLDVGSGAGLPGVPLAIGRQDLRVTLLEPLLRRWKFLTQTVHELGLIPRVDVLRGRAEDYPRLVTKALGTGEQLRAVQSGASAASNYAVEGWNNAAKVFEVVTVRAVAPLQRLIGWTVPLISPTGRLLALKGSGAARELQDAEQALRQNGLVASVLQVRAHPESDDTTVVVVSRR